MHEMKAAHFVRLHPQNAGVPVLRGLDIRAVEEHAADPITFAMGLTPPS
jgi:hypothetical protein